MNRTSCRGSRHSHHDNEDHGGKNGNEEAEEENGENEDEDEKEVLPKGLVLWRDGIRQAKTAAQVTILKNFFLLR